MSDSDTIKHITDSCPHGIPVYSNDNLIGTTQPEGAYITNDWLCPFSGSRFITAYKKISGGDWVSIRGEGTFIRARVVDEIVVITDLINKHEHKEFFDANFTIRML